MNLSLTTTGLVPLMVGSVEVFQSDPKADGLFWNLLGGSVSLNMRDPNGGTYSYPATIGSDGVARVTWTVIAPIGNWRRSWTITDSIGRHQVGRPYIFDIEAAP